MDFPEMKRAKQKVDENTCAEILEKETRGVLSLIGTNGYPYAFPINHYYDKTQNTIFFHCGKIGYKLDCIKENPQACFTVTEQGVKKDGEWWLTARSVIVFGKIREIRDPEIIKDAAKKLSLKFTSDADYIENEIREYLPATLLLALSVEHISGKTVREK